MRMNWDDGLLAATMYWSLGAWIISALVSRTGSIVVRIKLNLNASLYHLNG